jgi:tRNA pseudouridine55 synthase
MDGVLVLDKPAGLTSHDVVAIARRCTRESRIGHTGTLDPLATGVLPLACGRATRLIRFLTSSDKDYDAQIRFGVATDSFDITGNETSRSGSMPSPDEIERALESLRGEYLQVPPPFSAKKIAGERAYAMARRREDVTLAPVPVRVNRAVVLSIDGDTARVELTCSAGFYVRAFAHRLGELTGSGACLAALRRTRSGDFHLRDAIDVGQLQDSEGRWRASLMPLERLLPAFPSTTLTDEGRQRVSHGQDVLDVHVHRQSAAALRDGRPSESEWVRLLDTEGKLLAVATAGKSGDTLHPAVVLI